MTVVQVAAAAVVVVVVVQVVTVALTVEVVMLVLEVVVVVGVAVVMTEEEVAHEPSGAFSAQAGRLGLATTTGLGFEFGGAPELLFGAPEAPFGGDPTSTTVLMLAADDEDSDALFD